MVLKRWLTIATFVLLPFTMIAQDDQVSNAIEDWITEGGNVEVASEMADLLIQLRENPININDTFSLGSLPFITPFQRRAICNYIILHGQLISLKELELIPGFDSASCMRLAPFVKISPFNEPHTWKPWHGHHTLLSAIGATIEQAEGYKNGKYEGDNLRALLRYTYNYRDQISVRLCADKDPTEAWGKDNYYGYHLMLSNIGRLNKLIIGRYNIQFGQGLTLWTGLQPFNFVGGTPLHYGVGIRPASTFYEENYQEGIAATMTIVKGISTSAFVSKVKGETLTGGHINYHGEHLIIGITASYTSLDDSLHLRNYPYNLNYFRGDNLLNLGINAIWQWQRLTLFGEAATSTDAFAPVAIAGLQFKADSRNMFGICYRHYSPFYHNLHSQGYTIGNSQGEQGITLNAQTILPFSIETLVSLDLYSFQNLRYGCYSPSSGAWLRMQISREVLQLFKASVRYSYRQKERNIPNIDTSLYLNEQTLHQQILAEFRLSAGAWQINLKGALSQFASENSKPQKGWMIGIMARYSKKNIQATAGATYFDVNGYYARLYSTESNLQYFWTMPSFYGRGFRIFTLLRYNISDKLMLAAKYSLSIYPNKDSIGAGDAQIAGNHRQNLTFQVRWSF